LKRDPEPSIGVIDSQRVKTTEAGGDRGFDGKKKVNGRKRQILVDTNGLLLRVLVYAADISDSEGAEWLLQEHHQAFPRMKHIRSDQGYKESLAEWMKANTKMMLEVIEKPAEQVGFAVIPKRWVVERTFAWIGRSHRLSKEYEQACERSESFIYLSSIHIMLKRLYPSG
jgi:transposase